MFKAKYHGTAIILIPCAIAEIELAKIQPTAHLVAPIQKEEFQARINNLDWMSDETKAQALKKLESFNYKIGYPDKWRDYSALDLSAKTLLQNSFELRKHSYMQMVEEFLQQWLP